MSVYFHSLLTVATRCSARDQAPMLVIMSSSSDVVLVCLILFDIRMFLLFFYEYITVPLFAGLYDAICTVSLIRVV